MVLASSPVLSARRLAARPVGAHSATSTPLAAQHLQDGVDQGGLAHARAAGDHQHLGGERQAQRLPLAVGQGQAGPALDPGDRLAGVDRRPGRRARRRGRAAARRSPARPGTARPGRRSARPSSVSATTSPASSSRPSAVSTSVGRHLQQRARRACASSSTGRPQCPSSIASARAKEMPARTRIMAVGSMPSFWRHLVGGAEADAADVARQAVGVLGDDLHGVGAVGLEDPHRPRGADAVGVQEQHDLADHLLLGPAGDDARGPLRADAGHLAQPVRAPARSGRTPPRRRPAPASWRRPGRCRGSCRSRGTSRCPPAWSAGSP